MDDKLIRISELNTQKANLDGETKKLTAEATAELHAAIKGTGSLERHEPLNSRR